ncbi:MAG: hypothetical protein KatS3mg102_2493 [Planctomycetota bacterium]|nr:MAG: hypothetical protein KatS3mg102_2493 [Planctomycetota bacterium]
MQGVFKRSFAALVLGASLLAASGCANQIILKHPRGNDVLDNLGRAPGPAFSWATKFPEPMMEFTLLVARDSSFRDLVLRADRIRALSYKIPPDKEVFLKGSEQGTDYWWKVIGELRNEEGELEKTLEPENPRRFTIKQRDLVKIEIKLPDVNGAYLRVGDEEHRRGAEPRVASFTLENGKFRDLEIRVPIRDGATQRTLAVGGRLWVVEANENTRYSSVVVDNLTVDKLREIEQGGVGEHSYLLGGTPIVKIKLGSRAVSVN